MKTMHGYLAGLARRGMLRLVVILLSPLVFAGCASLGVQSAYLDATEVGTAFPAHKPVTTRIYTKVAGVAFSLDVLAGVYMTDNYSIQQYVTVGFPYSLFPTNVYAQGQSYIDLVDWTKSGGNCGTVGDANQVSGVTINTSGVGAYGGTSSGAYYWNGSEYGRKTYSFTVSQAAANVRVRIYGYNSSQGVSATGCSNDAFTIRPASLALASTPASGSTQVAGVNYTMKATALTNSGATATGYTGTPALTTTNMTDWGNQTIQSGSFTGSFSAASLGVASGSFAYSDFGPLTIPVGAVADTSFVANSGSGDASAGDCISGSTSNTASGGKYGCNFGNTTSATTPSFIAHHYVVNQVITPACSSKFTYLGQPLTLSMTIDAYNAAGTRLTRLTESAPNKPTFSWTQTNSGAATINPITMPSTNLKWSADSTYGTSSGGEYFTSTTTTAPYSLGSVAAATTRPVVTPPASGSSPPDYESFNLTVNTSDAPITSCNGVSVASTYACASSATKLRYGVLKLSDGQASSLTPATMQITAQYWNGSSFVTNTDDSCTTINFNAGTLSRTGLVGLLMKNNSTTLSNGVGAMMLGATAKTNLAIKLGSSDNNCVSATSGMGSPMNTLSGYLGGVGCSTSYDKDPSATVNYGTLRSTYIYRAEKF